MNVRKARKNDAEQITQFQILMARETEKMELDIEVVRRGVAGVFAEPARGTYWVVEAKVQLLGSMLVIPEWSDWRCGTVLWIHSLYIKPPARKQGLFRLLYQNLKQQVIQDPNLKGLRLYVDKTNSVAREVYEKLGMNRDHYEMYEWLK
ncbi:MAG: GNAT family N-acetyltransferase [Sedimentisphaerales bacterium]|nr:GNAT family N-acetyltransferase [Sedimentisphaerales bacterium]